MRKYEDTIKFHVRIISIPDEELFSETTVGAMLHNLSKLYDVPVGFVTLPYFETVHCFICGRRRVAAARYRIICLVFMGSSSDRATQADVLHLRENITLTRT